jgi:hypothetical protein
MPTLREVQGGLRDALFGADTTAVSAFVVDGEIAPPARLAIYRHHVLGTLTDVLRSVYPVVCRLVDDRFFAYAADAFVRRHPPSGPCLAEYGAGFPGFLAAFPPCRHLAWLADVARLEWAMIVAADAPDAVGLDPRLLRDVEPDDTPALVFRLQPDATYLASPWPVDDIWRANRRDDDAALGVDLTSGGVELEVRRLDHEVVMRRLDRATGAFRRAVAAGQPLDVAATVAAAADATFDLATAVAALLAEQLVTGFTIHLSPSRRTS